MVITFLGSLVQSCCGEGGMLQTNHWHVLAVSQPHWACPRSWRVHPPCPHSSGSRLLHWEPSKAGPGLHAPLRSKPLRFRHSGSPQRRRIYWACVLCPSQVQTAQVTRCLASSLSQDGAMHLITSLVPATLFPGCAAGVPSQVCRVFPLGS